MRDAAIAIADLPPSALPLLDPDQSAELRVLIVGGEPCPRLWRFCFARGRRFINAYGPTETTVTATFWEGTVTGVSCLSVALVPTCVRTCSTKSCACYRSARGQPYIAGIGPHVAISIDLRSAPERFLPDPFGPPGSRHVCEWRCVSLPRRWSA